MIDQIAFVGDPHGHFQRILDAIRQVRPVATVFLGDFGLDSPLDEVLKPIRDVTQVLFIPGNHDTDRPEFYDRLFDAQMAEGNIHGRVREISGVRMAGLGGVFREQIWMPPARPRWCSPEDFVRHHPAQRWRGGVPVRHRSTVWWSEYAQLWDERFDVLVSHEAPSCHRYGHEAIDDLALSGGASTIVHGHHHTTYRTTLDSGVTVQGVGLAGIVSGNGDVLLRGMQDEPRKDLWRRSFDR